MVNLPGMKKAPKIGRALKSAAMLPTRAVAGRGSGRQDMLSPLQGELPVVLLRVQVVGCKNLVAKDKGGTSDPFVTVTVMSTKHSTPVLKKNLNPDYEPKDATFDFPLYLSTAEKLGAAEFVVWDKDMFSKEYLGEASLMLNDWFPHGRALGFTDPTNEPVSLDLASTRVNELVQGSIQIKLGFVEPPQVSSLMTFEEVYFELAKRSRPRASIMSAPPTSGIGTIRSHAGGPEFEDDGFSSDEGEDDAGDYTDDEHDDHHASARERAAANKPFLSLPLHGHQQEPLGSQVPTPTGPDIKTPVPIPAEQRDPTTPKPNYISTSPEHSPTTTEPPMLHAPLATDAASGKPVPSRTGSGLIPKMLRRPTLPAALSPSGRRTPSRGMSKDDTPAASPLDETSAERSNRPEGKRGVSFRKRTKDNGYNLKGEEDIVGIVMLEIQSASDLPRLKNMTRTGWDMDPFVVVSFGKKVFRTRVIRHSRNPVWEEKLLFHVRRYETKFDVRLTVLDWDKISSNDHIGDATFPVHELVAQAPQKDGNTGLYEMRNDGHGEMKEYVLPLTTGKEMPWESKHNPQIVVKARYQSYGALRQRFWRQYLKQYDTDDSATISKLELTSMLDSLGSTLSGDTINAFYTSRGYDPETGELTLSEAVQALETELFKPNKERKRLDASDYHLAMDDTAASTPALGGPGAEGDPLGELDFAGPPGNIPDDQHGNADLHRPNAPPAYDTEGNQQRLDHTLASGPEKSVGIGMTAAGSSTSVPRMAQRHASSSSTNSEVEGEESSGSGNSSLGVGQVERVINVKTCPLCHRPRMSRKGEVDIITHLAICASQDWERVDKIVVGNFVTSSQAQRKWMAKLISKVSSGAYKLGANSANIIVQNRTTGQLEEEKMQVYVRLGIRLLYKGAKSRMEGSRARALLKSMSIKQGRKYDDPDSAKEIMPFIEFHRLNVAEMLEPPESYKTFNQFFYRKLKPDARPVEEPENPYRLVSGADCRMMAFETVQDATRIWIKGREFTVSRLLGDAYSSQSEKYQGGALAIFRLAPQDYHRFHSPVAGVVGPMTYIAGEYYTVNPQAIRTPLDVYGENARKIVPIDSPHFGRVMAVCIGAMMVGSIVTTKAEGDPIQRGEEFGYFAFGGSTIVLLFERGMVEWDEDLIINGKASLETLVRVGMGVGRRPGK